MQNWYLLCVQRSLEKQNYPQSTIEQAGTTRKINIFIYLSLIDSRQPRCAQHYRKEQSLHSLPAKLKTSTEEFPFKMIQFTSLLSKIRALMYLNLVKKQNKCINTILQRHKIDLSSELFSCYILLICYCQLFQLLCYLSNSKHFYAIYMPVSLKRLCIMLFASSSKPIWKRVAQRYCLSIEVYAFGSSLFSSFSTLKEPQS